MMENEAATPVRGYGGLAMDLYERVMKNSDLELPPPVMAPVRSPKGFRVLPGYIRREKPKKEEAPTSTDEESIFHMSMLVVCWAACMLRDSDEETSYDLRLEEGVEGVECLKERVVACYSLVTNGGTPDVQPIAGCPRHGFFFRINEGDKEAINSYGQDRFNCVSLPASHIPDRVYCVLGVKEGCVRVFSEGQLSHQAAQCPSLRATC